MTGNLPRFRSRMRFFFAFLFLAGLITGWDWPEGTRTLLQVVAIPGLILAVVTGIRPAIKSTPAPEGAASPAELEQSLGGSKASGRAEGSDDADADAERITDDPADEERMTEEEKREVARKERLFLGWIGGYALAVWLGGITVASPLFVWLYLQTNGRRPWWVGVTAAAGIWLFLQGFLRDLFQLAFPPAMLPIWLGF